jgi:integrase
MAIKPYMKDGKKLFLVEVKMRNRDGKQIYRSRAGITSERKAEEALFELKKEVEAIATEKPILTWKYWFDKCLVTMRTEFATSTVYGYEKNLNRYVTPHWKDCDIRRITKADVHELIFQKLPAEATLHTRKGMVKLMKRIFMFAVEAQEIAINPCSGISVKAPVNDQKVLGKAEVDILLTQGKITNHRFYPVWVLALKSGLRSGELHALCWYDIDFESRNLHVKRSWSSKNGLKETKSGKSRVVPISEDLLVFLKELKVRCGTGSQNVLPRLPEWDRGEQAEVLRDFCRSIGITPIRFHDLRATFITNLLSQGVPLAQVMAIVGHSQIDTTNEYLRKAGVDLKGATDRLGYEVPTFSEAQVTQLAEFRQGTTL